MSRQDSQAIHDRIRRLLETYAPKQRTHFYFYDGERRVELYQADRNYNSVALQHDSLQITLRITQVPPDDANLEFTNTILDAAEHIVALGKTEKS